MSASSSDAEISSLATDADTGYRKQDQPEYRLSNDSGGSEKDHTIVPEHKLASAGRLLYPSSPASESTIFLGILSRIGSPDHEGWMRKKEGLYNTWKNRYVVLKGPHLYWLRSDSVFVSIGLVGLCVRHPILSTYFIGGQSRRACQYHRLSHRPR
jgi:hypothetical protein